MVEKDHKGATHFNWRRMRIIGILLLLTVVQGNSPSMNPVTLTQGNMIEDSNIINPYTTMRSPVDTPPSITQLTCLRESPRPLSDLPLCDGSPAYKQTATGKSFVLEHWLQEP